MDKEEYFTLSFVNTRWRYAELKLPGSKSGRDIDKLKESSFKLFERPHGLSYTAAELIMVC